MKSKRKNRSETKIKRIKAKNSEKSVKKQKKQKKQKNRLEFRFALFRFEAKITPCRLLEEWQHLD